MINLFVNKRGALRHAGFDADILRALNAHISMRPSSLAFRYAYMFALCRGVGIMECSTPVSMSATDY